MNASCVTSSTSAGSRMKRESRRASLRWYFSTSRPYACLSPPCARVTSCRSISRSDIDRSHADTALARLPTPGLTVRLATPMCHRHTHLEIVRRRVGAFSALELPRRHAGYLSPQRPEPQCAERSAIQHVRRDKNRPSCGAAHAEGHCEAADEARAGELAGEPPAIDERENHALAFKFERMQGGGSAVQRVAPRGIHAKGRDSNAQAR